MTLPARLIELADRLNAECGRRVMQSNPNSADYYDPADPRRVLMAEAAEAIRALAAQALSVPEGFVLVPGNATKRMEEAGLQWLANFQHMRKQDRLNAIANAYAAMLAAAPKPLPPGPVGGG